MRLGTTEQLGQLIHHRPSTRFPQRPNDTGEHGKGVSLTSALRALRHVPGGHRRMQRPFRPIIRRLDPRVCQEAHQVLAVMMPAEFIEQPLIGRILQAAVAQVIRPLGVEGAATLRSAGREGVAFEAHVAKDCIVGRRALLMRA